MALFQVLAQSSAVEILLISFALAVMSGMATKIFLGEEGRAARQKLNDLQKEMKEAQKKGDAKKLQKLQGEMMTSMMDSFRHQFKPMLVTFIPFLLIFWWLSGNYGRVGAQPMVEIFGYVIYWFGWYFICIMVFSIPINKLLKNY